MNEVRINTMDKKIEIILTAIFTPLFMIVALGVAQIDNKQTYAEIIDQSIVFTKTESVEFKDIEEINLYDDVVINIRAHGYRWENNKYFSRDADVKIFDQDENQLLSVKKGKTYIDKKVNTCIYVKTESQEYIFNYQTTEKTKIIFDDIYSKLQALKGSIS